MNAPPRSADDADDEIDPDQHPRKLADCRRCGLWRNATQAVGGEGKRRATIMLVGEQPGDKEDLAGHPFVGPAGALLDKALAQAGVSRDAVYITNAVKHFKWQLRGKRRMHKSPAQAEIAACGYWLEQELDDIQPRVIIALGATALGALVPDRKLTLKAALGQSLLRGKTPVLVAYHPSFALRSPDPEGRQAAFQTIVEALRRAGRLADKA
ncbi:UdgX family uracil-DNA binding protein [Achromobacter xylosoxidans]|uniref:UdgX family uracil-DNA binding protein n=1 Tax=Alcaligenes xylosoxydans xylosoxydans TaxID=85698 RepID=UPI0006C5F4A8|nr:UdgX family uracil-DNA binding protein [Achromobacter xylosoxidans]MCH4573682.1 UdgX family uracil-DNA binding protein [Achromobacter xylosoxidans]MDD7992095.1 UdgX family uracil-DNA binding protein [Achromobacter xylosoxidans]OFO62366.1 hydroxyacid dehydrogenase [Achromobacter xylosoxidans]OMG77528.1 hydroxyacid dehydrogenase [Achromobacter xylosoxidans]PNL96423.1 hydroxyacid dehydrogenase [Achromobacter xylosoxidans]